MKCGVKTYRMKCDAKKYYDIVFFLIFLKNNSFVRLSGMDVLFRV